MKVNFPIDKIGYFADLPNPLPPLDIIVMSHNNLALTATCINSVFEQTNSPFHMIVVDDSTDLTLKYLEQLKKDKDNVTVVHSDVPYKEGNSVVNAGLAHTKYDFVVNLTNSMTVCFFWEVHAMQLMKQDYSVGVVGMKSLTPAGCIENAGLLIPPHGDPIDIGHDLPGQLLTNIYEVPIVPWCFVLLRRKAITEPLPEGIYYPFRGWDDVDNCFVLKQKGWKVYYCGYGAGYHLACATRGSSLEDARKQSVENGVRFRKRWELGG